MMYGYMTLSDETEIVHSHLIDEEGVNTVLVHFERPINGGFDSVRFKLPTYEIIMRDGYSDEDVEKFKEFTKNNAHLFYKYAKTGGLDIAKAI